MENDPRKQVPCPWDPGATCPEDSKQYMEFEDYGDFMIVSWKKNGKRGHRVIDHPAAIHFIRRRVLGAIPEIGDMMEWKEKKEVMEGIRKQVEELQEDVHLKYERMMLNGLLLSVGAFVEFYAVQEKEAK